MKTTGCWELVEASRKPGLQARPLLGGEYRRNRTRAPNLAAWLVLTDFLPTKNRGTAMAGQALPSRIVCGRSRRYCRWLAALTVLHTTDRWAEQPDAHRNCRGDVSTAAPSPAVWVKAGGDIGSGAMTAG